MLRQTADDALAVSHDGDRVADHVRYGDAQQFLSFVGVPQTNILRRAGRHQLTAAAVYETYCTLENRIVASPLLVGRQQEHPAYEKLGRV